MPQKLSAMVLICFVSLTFNPQSEAQPCETNTGVTRGVASEDMEVGAFVSLEAQSNLALFLTNALKTGQSAKTVNAKLKEALKQSVPFAGSDFDVTKKKNADLIDAKILELYRSGKNNPTESLEILNSINTYLILANRSAPTSQAYQPAVLGYLVKASSENRLSTIHSDCYQEDPVRNLKAFNTDSKGGFVKTGALGKLIGKLKPKAISIGSGVDCCVGDMGVECGNPCPCAGTCWRQLPR